MTLYLCSRCNGVHDSTEPGCTSTVVVPIGIGTHNPSLVEAIHKLARYEAVVALMRDWSKARRCAMDQSRIDTYAADLAHCLRLEQDVVNAIDALDAKETSK